MKVEIWSDIMCPFCYMGKRKFEQALAQFDHADEVEIEWKSFQLSPDLKTDPSKSIYEYLAVHKGMTIEHAKQLSDQVAASAKQLGLQYDFDRAVPANTFRAQRLIHLAKSHGLQNEAEEILFQAYFSEGLNIDDQQTLLELADKIGLDATESKEVLNGDLYTDSVLADIREAQQLGVRGVPFFVFDRKVAVSGAQDVSVFLEVLEEQFELWRVQ